MTKFTSTEIAKVLNIPKGRLRGWREADRQLFQGSIVKPSGSGIHEIFSYFDLLSFAIFNNLIGPAKINRERAGKILSEIKLRCSHSVDYVIVSLLLYNI